MNPRLGFLVYDSRSGSTLLAKILTQSFPSVFVTPEIGFDELFARGDKWLASAAPRRIEDVLYAKPHYLRNLPLNRSQVGDLIRGQSPGKWTIQQLLPLLLKQAFLDETGKTSSWIIVKNGSHIKYWRELAKAFGPDIAFINIVRDPRAVVYSKLNTLRPYVLGESMAWGGAMLAAWRWRLYLNAWSELQAVNLPRLCVRYEDLLLHPDATVSTLATFLGCQPRERASARDEYVVPEREQGIHTLVQLDNMRVARIDAWKSGLTRQDVSVIETITYQSMRRFGYVPVIEATRIAKCWAMLASLPRVIHGLGKQSIRRIWQCCSK